MKCFVRNGFHQTSMQDVIDAAARIPHAQISVLPGSHFLPLEFPQEIHAHLDELAKRAGVRAH